MTAFSTISADIAHPLRLARPIALAAAFAPIARGIAAALAPKRDWTDLDARLLRDIGETPANAEFERAGRAFADPLGTLGSSFASRHRRLS